MSRRPFGARVLLLLAAASLALAVVVLMTGGFRVYVFDVPLSTRGTFRPLVAALTLAAAALLIDPALRRRLQAFIESVLRLPLIRRCAAPVVTIAAAAWMLYAGVSMGSRAAGGADSYGYVSQAALWSEGRLHVRQDFAATMPWPRADATFSPLGYRPAPGHPHTLVPTYPPGLPLIMAAFERPDGRDDGALEYERRPRRDVLDSGPVVRITTRRDRRSRVRPVRRHGRAHPAESRTSCPPDRAHRGQSARQ